MKRFWFKSLIGVLTVAGLGLTALLSPHRAGAFQEASTPSGILATVIYAEPINVRSGPSTVFYPIIGQLQPGEVVPALGVSPGREWVQISFAGGVNGIGWIYASFVTISGGELQIAEPPPTPTPLVSATIDPTLAAAFIVQPTQTRMPTFTPPPPLVEVPQYTDAATSRSSGAAGIFIVILVAIGALGLTASFVLRK
jgi:hypothetical protein